MKGVFCDDLGTLEIKDTRLNNISNAGRSNSVEKVKILLSLEVNLLIYNPHTRKS